METEAAHYFTAAQRVPRLDRQEEADLIRRWQSSGDRAAANRLATAQQRQVVALALRYRHSHVPLSELVAEGNLGFMHALRKFDLKRGLRFATYAHHWVRAYMLTHVVKSRSVVAGGGGAMRTQLFFKLRKERVRMSNLLGVGEQADRAVAQRLGLSFERTQELMQRLDARDVPVDGTGASVLDSMATTADQESEVLQEQLQRNLQQVVTDALATLDARELYIAEHRLMSSSEETLALAEIARRFDVSRERTRQLEVRAMKKLRHALRASANPIVAEWILETKLNTEDFHHE
jgi:RNA polymerase sigma-32 factor